jgi:AcrR family transcriptional regulator
MAKRRRLNRQAVVEKAAELADAAGRPEAVSLTALAESLEVQVPSLYNHIGGQQDLRHALAIHGLRLLLAHLREATLGKVGREALLATCHLYREFAGQHPGLYPLTIRAPDPADEELNAVSQDLLQMLLLLLASMGLEGEQALHAVRALRAMLHGFVALEAAGGFKMPLALDESFDRLVVLTLDGLAASVVNPA